MSSCENSISEATEIVNMPLTSLTAALTALSQEGGSSAVLFLRSDS